MTQQNYKIGQIFEPSGKEIIYSEQISTKDLLIMVENKIEFDGYVVDIIDHPFIKYLIKTDKI